MQLNIKRQVLTTFWPYRTKLVLALLQVALISAIELLKPWPMKLIIDHILGKQPLQWTLTTGWSGENLLFAACMSMIIIYILVASLQLLHNHTILRIGHNMVRDLRRKLYQHLHCLSLAFHHHSRIGDLLYRVTSDTISIQTLTMSGVFPILSSFMLLIGMTVVMLHLDCLLTLIALSICPVLFFAASRINAWIDAAAVQARKEESTLYCIVQQSMTAINATYAFNREKYEQDRFASVNRRCLSAILRVLQVQTLYVEAVSVFIAAGIALVLWVGAHHVMDNKLSVGELIVFTTYLAMLYAPMQTISRSLAQINGAKAGLKRVYEILTMTPDLPDGQRVLPSTVRGNVHIEQVTFGYTADQIVLKDIELHVAAGQTAAIVGSSGSGKSTLTSLLPRFYDPQHGRVLLDGIDIREFSLTSLRDQIAMVLQPSIIFPGTIFENIAYGRQDSTRQDIQHAAQVAHIHETIMRLPQGYETAVGEHGATLSEGERQRLTIARAVLRDAPILIFDEPTSSLDAETEFMIMESLKNVMKHRTTFIIAHRLSTVQQADLILVMDQGRIVEQGSFSQLISHAGPFEALYRTQFNIA